MSNAMSNYAFEGKRALVTGGTKGMGEAIVRALAARGATVIAPARKQPEDPVASVRYVEADLASVDGVRRLVDTVQGEFGHLDLLVNNVGGSSAPGGGALALTDAMWDEALQLNLMSAVRVDRAFLPAMVERGVGAIVHITSIQRRLPLYGAPGGARRRRRRGRPRTGDGVARRHPDRTPRQTRGSRRTGRLLVVAAGGLGPRRRVRHRRRHHTHRMTS